MYKQFGKHLTNSHIRDQSKYQRISEETSTAQRNIIIIIRSLNRHLPGALKKNCEDGQEQVVGTW